MSKDGRPKRSTPADKKTPDPKYVLLGLLLLESLAASMGIALLRTRYENLSVHKRIR